MSIKIMSRAWDCTLPPTDKLVLLALADWSNDQGQCWPSMKQLCSKSGLTERGIQKVMLRLIEGGHLTRQELTGRGNVYSVHPRTSFAPTPERDAPPPPNDIPPERRSPPNESAETPERGSGNTSVTVNREEGDKPLLLGASDAKRGSRLAIDWTPTPLPQDMRGQVLAMPAGWVERELSKFRDYWAAKPGAGGRKLDWDATWRNWLRKAIEDERRQGNRGSGRPASGAGGFARMVAASMGS
jgi:hypothetical protein